MNDSTGIVNISCIPNLENFKKKLRKRMMKQQAFFNRREKGDILVYTNYRNRGIPYLQYYFYNLLLTNNLRDLCDYKIIKEIVLNYVMQVRSCYFGFYNVNDDALPSYTEPHFHIGSVTAAMTNKNVIFNGQTVACYPQLSWHEIENLKIDKNNPWILFMKGVHRALWELWDEDYLIGGGWYHSPLDAAWAIRGSDIFEEMITEPDKVEKLIDWCADSIVEMEKIITEDSKIVNGFRGVLSTLVPDNAILINGDPIDLISKDFGKKFEIPYVNKVFRELGAGFYHHHSKGLHQVPIVSQIKNMHLHNIVNDYPNTPDLAETLINNKDIREEVIEASFISPIMIDGAHHNQLEKLIPILQEGRFVIDFICDSLEDANDCIKKIENINSLK
jgi:hypothetical protein